MEHSQNMVDHAQTMVKALLLKIVTMVSDHGLSMHHGHYNNSQMKIDFRNLLINVAIL